LTGVKFLFTDELSVVVGTDGPFSSLVLLLFFSSSILPFFLIIPAAF
jgi:hypothetical protein